MFDDMKVLLRAADMVERGWCQGRLMSVDGRVCAYGALMATLSGKKGHCEAFVTKLKLDGAVSRAVERICRKWLEFPEDIKNTFGWHAPWELLVTYNDEPDRTVADIAKLFREGAVRAALGDNVENVERQIATNSDKRQTVKTQELEPV